ncbi:MAG TPA: hypothetical protein VFR32_00690 [Gaiellaceae bacterium]|nr:hypothetical protein [Gaiellaceae bacterium]
MRTVGSCLLLGTLISFVLAVGPAEATFPGANGPIIFVSTRDGNQEIYRMNADGSGQTRLTNHPAVESEPNASPGGAKIAFVSGRDGNWEIYSMNANGSSVTRLTNDPRTDVMPRFSPDGKRLAFVSTREGPPRIYLMNADGTGVTRVTNGPGVDSEPTWAPNGNAIAFTSTRNGAEDLFQVRPDGTGVVRLTENPARDFAPDYSPNGKQLLFSSNRGGTFDLWLMDLPAGLGLRLGDALDDKARKVTDRPERKSHGRFSPDGKRVVFEGQPAGRTDFQVIEKAVDGGSEKVLTQGASNHQPFWVSTAKPKPRPCKCKSLTAQFLPTLLKNNRLQPDRHDFGIGFKWKIVCTKGKGGCTGTINVMSPQVFVDKIKQPQGALKIAADSFQFGCAGPCGGSRSKTVTIKMRSRDQLTKLIGQEFAFQVRTRCSGVVKTFRVQVLVDAKGGLTARVSKAR